MKPGQFCTINGVTYRAKKRYDNCHGCALNSLLLCPMIVKSQNTLDCIVDNIIFVRI